MLKNAYLLAKIGADTAENEQHFVENLPKIGNYRTGPPGRGLRVRREARRAEAAPVLPEAEAERPRAEAEQVPIIRIQRVDMFHYS